MSRLHPLVPILALLLTAATPRSAVGFVNLTQLMANDPMHSVLLGFDREIAALRSTRNLSGLTALSAQAAGAARAVRDGAASAQIRARAIGSRGAAAGHARESAALAALLASQRSGDREIGRFTGELNRETATNATNYASALATRNDRAYAARAQELREKELTLAFDLARQNAGRRLSLRIKLTDLHLSRMVRAKLQAQLAALDAAERRPVAVLRARDAATLAAYRRKLESETARESAQMDARLRQTASANYALRARVLKSEAQPRAASRNLASGAAAFAATLRPGAASTDIAAGFQSAGDDVARRLDGLGAMAQASQRETNATLESLVAMRRALYRTIVARVELEAQLVARRRGIDRVVYGSAPPSGSVNLTGAVRAALTRS